MIWLMIIPPRAGRTASNTQEGIATEKNPFSFFAPHQSEVSAGLPSRSLPTLEQCLSQRKPALVLLRRGSLRSCCAASEGWARQDSNLGPRDYESPALTAELQAHFHR